MHIKGISKLTTAVLLGIFCAALTASAQVKQGTAVVRALTGSASYVDSSGISQPLAVGTVVKEGQTVQTSFDGSVTLYLAENGPGVALNPGSVLRLDKLAATQSPLGTVIDTRLDLQRGQLYGTVDKLLPGSHYEVKTPTGVATVRGTTFYIDASTGDVTVTSGTVQVKVVLNTQIGQLVKTVTVQAGQTLTIPKQFNKHKEFDELVATATPNSLSQKNIDKLVQLGKLTKYTSGSANGKVTETFTADQKKQEDHIKLDRPPVISAVSP